MNTVLHLSREEVLAIIAKFEADGGQAVTSDEVQLLERYLLEHPDDAALSGRYESALKHWGQGQ